MPDDPQRGFKFGQNCEDDQQHLVLLGSLSRQRQSQEELPLAHLPERLHHRGVIPQSSPGVSGLCSFPTAMAVSILDQYKLR